MALNKSVTIDSCPADDIMKRSSSGLEINPISVKTAGIPAVAKTAKDCSFTPLSVRLDPAN